MPVQVVTDHRAETMMTHIFVYRTQLDPPLREYMRPDGAWLEAAPAHEVLPTYRVPDDLVPLLANALGVPMSDAHLTDALRLERARVDRMLDRMSEAVTRGL